MNFRRTLSILLAVLTVAACAVVAGTAVASGAAGDAAATSAYQDMLADVSADYGLADTVNEGTILQAWNWSFSNIEANLEKIADQGFTTIQVSPPNVLKADTKGVHVLESSNQNGWWMFYQPAGFQINGSSDNNSALGTKSEFVSMCSKAHTLGLKVIVDTVINHMGTKDNESSETSTDPMAHVTPKAQTYEPAIWNAKAFHTPWAEMTYKEDPNQFSQYDSTYDLTRNCTSRLPDLDTGSSIVQSAIYDYMDELISSGADGFRFDAAKHIETPDDISSLKSDFWTNTLQKVRTNHPESEVYAYGEILNTCGVNRPYSMYTKLFDVTDSGSYWSISNAVKGYGGDATPYYPNSNFTKANTILWDESHDTYIDGSTTDTTVAQRNKIWALCAGRADITTVYFARPDDSTSTNACYNILLGDIKMTAWSNAVTKAINQFHNYFIGTSEYCTAGYNGYAYIERGDSGAMIVHLGNTAGGSVTVPNHTLKNGTYIDAITGNTFTVSGGYIRGTVGSSGVACIYFDNDTVPTTPTSTYSDDDVVPTKDGYYTVLFSNSKNWDGSLYLYYWNDSESPVSWPGETMTYYQVNEYNEGQYIGYVPVAYNHFIVSNGSSQTTDGTISGHTGAYAGDDDGTGKAIIGYFEIITVKPTQQPSSSAQPESSSATEQGQSSDSQQDQSSGSSDTYMIGDADGNGEIEISDATTVQRHLARLIALTGSDLLAADADESGEVDVSDATAIQRWLARIDRNNHIGDTK